MSGEKRWVVRVGSERGKGPYVTRGHVVGSWDQSEAWRYDIGAAHSVARDLGGRVVRLISRSEAVERASRKARDEGRLEGMRWAYAEALKAGNNRFTEPMDRMLAAMCPCQSEVDDPGPTHVDECPWGGWRDE